MHINYEIVEYDIVSCLQMCDIQLSNLTNKHRLINKQEPDTGEIVSSYGQERNTLTQEEL
jgi:hypothetical protein